MKKTIAILALCFACYSATAQNITKDANGNYVQAKAAADDVSAAINTGKTYTDAKGIVYPVWKSKNDKLFVIVTSKAGNKYKKYLKIN